MKFCRILLILSSLLLTACKPPQATPTPPPGDYRRVVTLSPSLSETMYALGLGDRIVGVTAFARYPEDVNTKPRIGGYTDVNIEAVFSKRPDMVLALDQQQDTIRQLRSLGLTVCEFRNETIADIVDLIHRTGTLFNRTQEAEALIRNIEDECNRLKAQAAGQPRQRILISVGRNMGNGQIGDVYAAGPNTLFGEIIELAGGQNVYDGKAPYVALSREAILRTNPQVIIDLIPDMDKIKEFTRLEALEQWNEFKEVDAVHNKRVTINMSSYICIPGPRITLMMHDIAEAIYPKKKETSGQ